MNEPKGRSESQLTLDANGDASFIARDDFATEGDKRKLMVDFRIEPHGDDAQAACWLPRPQALALYDWLGALLRRTDDEASEDG